MKYAWSGKGKNIFLACLAGMILFFLPGCDFGPERPNEGFFYYTGFRDWWRIPLVYPFQIQVIDCFDSGSFTRHKIPSLVAHSESTQLLSEVTVFLITEITGCSKEQNLFPPFTLQRQK